MSSAKRPHTFSVIVSLLTAFIAAFLLSNCANDSGNVIEVEKTSGFQASHGPFDKNGNYIEKWADSPPKRKYVTTAKSQPEPHRPANLAPTPRPPEPTVASVSTQKKPSTRPTSYSKPKPRPTVAKPKPILVKPKTRPAVSHTVRKGDTLYALSRKYGASVSAIQKANRLSGTNIRLGQRLKIPR